MGPLETAVRERVRPRVWPSNPSSVRLADAAMRMARLIDGGDTREMLRHYLKVTVSHLAGCGPREGNFLDEIRARMCARMADQFERSTVEFGGRINDG